MVVGCWLLVVGCWLLVVGCWSRTRDRRGSADLAFGFGLVVVLEGWLIDGRLALAFGLWYFGFWLWLLVSGILAFGLWYLVVAILVFVVLASAVAIWFLLSWLWLGVGGFGFWLWLGCRFGGLVD